MCGFIGRILDGQIRDDEGLSRALPYLRRRGPDSCAMWQSEDLRIQLLHTRLAIVDPDVRATQPFEDRVRGLVVVFNGEIYNYPELRREFVRYPFATTSDTEVILAAYALYGSVGLNRLRGMYSLVIVDARSRRVLLARDPVGKKPFYISRHGGAVAFGSSVMALLAVQQRAGEINPEAVEFFWRETFIRPDQCIVKGITPVLPGQVVELNWQGEEIGRHLHSPSVGRIYDGEPFEAVVATAGQLLEQSVERRLRDNPEPAVLCSGGIDSTVITKVAVRLARQGSLPTPLRILTLGAVLPLTNDELYARYAVGRLGETVEVIRPNKLHLSRHVRDSISLQDEPLAMLSFFPMARLVASTSGISRVLLTGDGGDEVFLGYGQSAMWRRPEDPSLPAHTGHIFSGPPLPPWMSSWGASMVTDHMVGHGFAKVDRASAEQGVEVRCPLLDWDLMSYIRTVPFAMLTQGGVMKAVLKQQLADWPQWFLNRRKMGFVMNLRWLWWLSSYDGLRTWVLPNAQEQFAQWLPPCLTGPAENWSNRNIFRHFTSVWRLLVWSEFLRRMQGIERK